MTRTRTIGSTLVGQGLDSLVFHRAVDFFKREEKMDIYDHDTRFSPLLVRLNTRKTR